MMRRIDRFNTGRPAAGIVLGFIFTVMLVLNFLTPYIADDYVYMFAFDTKLRLESLSQIIPSMYLHCLRMNGRVVSHTLEQLFMLLPKPVFNLCNALVYTLTIWLLYRIENYNCKRNALLLALTFMGMWYFMPAFGQVSLWQVGSLNYMWAVTLCIVFVIPYMILFVKDRDALVSPWSRGLFTFAAVLIGMYSEISSFAAICLSGAFLLLCCLEKKSLKSWLWMPIIAACAGYLIMLSFPAQIAAKSAGSLNLQLLIRNFQRATIKLKQYCLTPLIIWGIVFLICLGKKTDIKRLIASALFVVGAIGANYMTVVASYYPERCLCTSIALLVLSICILIAHWELKKPVLVFAIIATFFFGASLKSGTQDIYLSWRQFMDRETFILTAKENGKTEFEVDTVKCDTQYSAFWGLRDLSTEDSADWPNSSMAKYYAVDKILGK